MKDKPNILIITTDQQSHRMMSCAGNSWLHTPNMDRIAQTGTRFDHAYCSNPVCAPSRFSWWTGRMPSVVGMRYDGGVSITIPEEVHAGGLGHQVRAAGYQPMFAGKAHLRGGLSPESLGFDLLSTDDRDRVAVESAQFIRERPDLADPWLLAVNLINPHDICYFAIRAFAETDVEKRLIERGAVECAEIDAALELAEVWDEEQFFADRCPPLPDNHQPQADEAEMIGEFLRARPFKIRARERWSEREWRLHRWVYHRLVERVDSQIGVILDALGASGQDESTVVIFTSDHGDHDGSHKLEHKTVFYDEAARIPFIVRDPDAAESVSGPAISGMMVQTGLDLMATVCDYAGAEQPAHNLGLSVRPLLAGEQPDHWRDGVYAENELGLMYATPAYKFVRYDRGRNNRQLYDLVGDPGETRNCIGDDGMEAIAKDLESRLEEERRRHLGDTAGG